MPSPSQSFRTDIGIVRENLLSIYTRAHELIEILNSSGMKPEVVYGDPIELTFDLPAMVIFLENFSADTKHKGGLGSNNIPIEIRFTIKGMFSPLDENFSKAQLEDVMYEIYNYFIVNRREIITGAFSGLSPEFEACEFGLEQKIFKGSVTFVNVGFFSILLTKSNRA